MIDRNVTRLFHCGDLIGQAIVETCSRLPFYFTFGNHDADMARILLSAADQNGATCLEWGGLIELANKKIGLAHGHLTRDLKPILDQEPDYLFTGHSHRYRDWWDGPTRRINPGALHRASKFTYAILNLCTDELEFVEVK